MHVLFEVVCAGSCGQIDSLDSQTSLIEKTPVGVVAYSQVIQGNKITKICHSNHSNYVKIPCKPGSAKVNEYIIWFDSTFHFHHGIFTYLGIYIYIWYIYIYVCRCYAAVPWEKTCSALCRHHQPHHHGCCRVTPHRFSADLQAWGHNRSVFVLLMSTVSRLFG